MGEDEKKLLIDIHREVGVTQTKVEAVADTVNTHIQTTKAEFDKINELDAEQNLILAAHKASLDTHIEGVNTLKEMYVSHRQESEEKISILRENLKMRHEESIARIEALEKPYDFVKYAGKVAVWVGGILGVVLTVLKIMEMW